MSNNSTPDPDDEKHAMEIISKLLKKYKANEPKFSYDTYTDTYTFTRLGKEIAIAPNDTFESICDEIENTPPLYRKIKQYGRDIVNKDITDTVKIFNQLDNKYGEGGNKQGGYEINLCYNFSDKIWFIGGLAENLEIEDDDTFKTVEEKFISIVRAKCQYGVTGFTEKDDEMQRFEENNLFPCFFRDKEYVKKAKSCLESGWIYCDPKIDTVKLAKKRNSHYYVQVNDMKFWVLHNYPTYVFENKLSRMCRGHHDELNFFKKKLV